MTNAFLLARSPGSIPASHSHDYPQTSAAPASIPYNAPRPLSQGNDLLPPNANRFDPRGAASPAPSHRSIGQLGGIHYASSEASDDHPRRGGALRVMNEEREEDDGDGLAYARDEPRGPNFDPYDGLAAGLDRTGSVAPSYRTHAR